MEPLYDSVARLAEAAATETPLADPVRARLLGPLNIALAGRVNAGKSTLLNALLGERLAPTDATECTRLVTRYTHGQVYNATTVAQGGLPTPIRFERDAEGIHLALPKFDGSPPVISVTAPNVALRSMTLIDTPGLGSEDPERVSATTAALGVGGERAAEADAVVYLLRHAHRTDVDTLEALRDRWAGNGSAFNVIAVLSRADEIGGGRLDAMESAARVAERYEDDGRLRGLATVVLPVAGLLGETGATLREEEFLWLRAVAAASGTDRALLGTALFMEDPGSPLTAEVRRLLLGRLGLFGLRFAIARIRQREAEDAPALARQLIEVSGLSRLRAALTSQFAERARTLKAVSALEGLRAVAQGLSPVPSWAAQLEELEASSSEVVELRTLQCAIDGLVDLPPEALRRLAVILSPGTAATRLGLPQDASGDDVRAGALRDITEWRTLAADPLASRLTASACETAARAAEQIFAAG